MDHNDSSGSSDYLGARLGDEQRLVLVPLDPDRPWAAFRRMRAWMKRAPKEAPCEAQIIPFPRNDAER